MGMLVFASNYSPAKITVAAKTLATQAEMANTRRKEIQELVLRQAKQQTEAVDLSTTSVLILCNPQWQGGVLGLVASQVAQEFGKPTILLSFDRQQNLWKGSARSARGIDLYELVQSQGPLLHRFGGHPFAAGLSVRPANLELFEIGINQKARQLLGAKFSDPPPLQVDLVVAVADLGKALFQELKYLEPCGLGNPVPKLMVTNCSLEVTHFQKLRDKYNRKLNYFKTTFSLWDHSGDIEGTWWGGHPDDLLQGDGLDVVLELDYSSVTQKYCVRLLAIAHNSPLEVSQSQTILDCRHQPPPRSSSSLAIQAKCPSSWDELSHQYQRAVDKTKSLALAYGAPSTVDFNQALRLLVGIARYLVNSQTLGTWSQLQQKLNCGDRALHLGLDCLINFGFTYQIQTSGIRMLPAAPQDRPELLEQFQSALIEEQFQQQYFAEVPVEVLEQTLNRST